MQLMEIEDQPWCPAVIRDGTTDYLQFALNAAKPYSPLAPRLASVIRDSGTREVVVLCSAGGGPWATLSLDVSASVDGVGVTLTDLFPNREAVERTATLAGDVVRYRIEPVDATSVPRELSEDVPAVTAMVIPTQQP